MSGAGLRELRDGDPARIGPYRLLARLGAGGMGQVYLGRSHGRRLVAVKIVHPHLADDTAFLRRFAKEVEAARRIGGFYTAQVVDADTAADPPWLVTEYIAGPSLQNAVDEQGPLPAVSVAALGAGLAEGLMAVHEQDVVHRDLKPGNVLLAPDGPRIIDFGIARAMDAGAQSTTRAGTPGYIPPELYLGRGVGPSGDVFCLAALLAFAATGRHPFGEGPADALGYRIRHEEPDLADVPEPLRPLIAAGLAKEPDDRPGTAEFLNRCAEQAEGAAGPGGGSAMPEAFTTMIATRVAETESFAGRSGTGEREQSRPPREPQRRQPRQQQPRRWQPRPPARPPQRSGGKSVWESPVAGGAAILVVVLLIVLVRNEGFTGSSNAGSGSSTSDSPSASRSTGDDGDTTPTRTRSRSPSPTPDPTFEAFDAVSVGDCLDAHKDPYDSSEWSENKPDTVSCGRSDAYVKVYKVASSSSSCDAESLDGESYWRSPTHDGDRIYLCVRRQFQKGDCFLGKEGSKKGKVAINGHGLMTSWGCGKGTVPRDFDYIMQFTGYYESRCPSGSKRWDDYRKGVLCARVV